MSASRPEAKLEAPEKSSRVLSGAITKSAQSTSKHSQTIALSTAAKVIDLTCGLDDDPKRKDSGVDYGDNEVEEDEDEDYIFRYIDEDNDGDEDDEDDSDGDDGEGHGDDFETKYKVSIFYCNLKRKESRVRDLYVGTFRSIKDANEAVKETFSSVYGIDLVDPVKLQFDSKGFLRVSVLARRSKTIKNGDRYNLDPEDTLESSISVRTGCRRQTWL